MSCPVMKVPESAIFQLPCDEIAGDRVFLDCFEVLNACNCCPRE